MIAILLGVVPVFALIALGYALKRGRFLTGENWAPVERLTYFVFYPGFLIPTIWRADFSGAAAGALGLATVSTMLLIGAAGVLARPLIPVSGPAFTSVFQGLIRWNSFVLLPVAAAVFGPEGLGLAAVVVGLLVPPINVISVLVMSKWGDGQGGGWRMAGRSMLGNPILWSCAIGMALNLSGVPRLPLILGPLELLGAAAVTLGLIVAGAGLSFRGIAERPLVIGGVTMVKLLVTPVLMWGLTRLFGGDETAQGIALLCGAAPGAAAAYVLARQMGGDAPLMAGIVAITTVASAATIPLMLALFGYA